MRMRRGRCYKWAESKGYDFNEQLNVFHIYLATRGTLVRYIKMLLLPKKGSFLEPVWFAAMSEIGFYRGW